MLQDEDLKQAISDALNFDVLRTLEPGTEEYIAYERNPLYTPDNITYSDINELLIGTRKLLNGGIKQTIDRYAARDLIAEKIDQTSYEKWLKDVFSDVVEKEGIRNNKDYFTPSGNRRSFEALHYEHNLENVIKAMKESGEKGIGVFGTGSIFGASTTDFGSIQDIKKAEGRIQKLSQEEYDSIRDEFSDRFFEIASRLPTNKSSFSANDDAANMLIEAVVKYKTRSGMDSYLRRESKGWANYSPSILDDLLGLVKDIREMPTEHFEAKPKRSVGFDEITTAIIPDNSSQDLKSMLDKQGISYVEYQNGDEKSRTDALNSLENVKFSRDNPTVAELQRENNLLKERLDYWKSQTKLTERTTVRLRDVDKVARDTLKKYDSKADFGTVRNSMKYLADDMRNGGVSWGKMQTRVNEIAKAILDSSQTVTNTEEVGIAKDIKASIKGTKISLGDAKTDIADFEDFRKRNLSRITFSESGTPMDVVWLDLQDQFGNGFFPEDITHPADQAQHLAQLLSVTSEYGNPYKVDYWSNVEYLANEILDDLFSDAVRDTAPTFADRKNAKITELDQKLKESRDKVKSLRKEKEQLRKTYQDARAKSVDGRKKTVIRNQIKDMGNTFRKMLTAPKKGVTQHVPVRLASTLAKFCDLFAESQELGAERQLVALEGKSIASVYRLQNGEITEAEAKRLTNQQEIIARKNARIVKTQKRLVAMREAYAELKGDSTDGLAYNEVTAKLLTELEQELAGKDILNMTRQELEMVKKTMDGMMHAITDANKMFVDGKEMGLIETGTKFAKDMTQAVVNHNKVSDALRGYWMKQMTPDVFFKYLGGYVKNGAGETLQRMFVEGETKMLGVQRDFYNQFKHLTESENKQERKEVFQLMKNPTKQMVDIGMKDRAGNSVKFTRGMMMQLYMLLSQNDSLESISRGGLKLPKAREYYNGDMDKAYSGADIETLYSSEGSGLFELSEEMKKLERDLKAEGLEENVRAGLEERLREVKKEMGSLAAGEKARLLAMRDSIEKQLTATEKKCIETAKAWYAYSGKLMGDVFESMYGYRPMLVENYVPIHRDETSVKMDLRVENGEINLEDSGFTKKRVKSAAPILLTDFFTELNRQQNAISRYYGFAEAQRNFNRIWNMQIPGTRNTIKGMVAAKFGDGKGALTTSGVAYVENYIADIAGGNTQENVLSSFYGMAASATLSLNPRVAFSQLASIPTAAAEIGWKNMAVGFFKGIQTSFSTKRKNELAQKSVYFFQRYRGEGGITEIADLKAHGGIWDKVTSSGVGKALFNWCQNFDVFATASMWSMAEEQVKSNGIKPGSSEYQNAVEQVYENIIRKTQPNYTVTERSDLLRDKRGGMKLVTMYKTQSNQNLNILMSANMEFNKMKRDLRDGRNGVTQADVKAAGKRFLNSATAVIIGGQVFFVGLRTMINFITRAVNGYRDDDTDEVTPEETLKAMVREMLSSVAGMFTLGSDVYDLLESIVLKEKYYGITDSALAQIVGLAEKSVDFVNTMRDEDADSKGKWKSAGKEVESFLNCFGAPASNARKLGEAVDGWVRDIKNGTPFAYSSGKTTDNQYRARFLNAYRNGDKEKCADVVAYLLSEIDEPTDARAEKKLQSGFKDFLKERYLDEEVTAKEVKDILHGYLEMDPEDVDAALNKWRGESETGKTESDMVDDYLRKTISGEAYMQYLQTYGGKSREQAESAELKLRCERDEGIAYSEIKGEYLGKDLSGDRAAKLLSTYGDDVSMADAKSKVLEWDFEAAYGIAYSDRKRAFLDGEISKNDLLTGLQKYGGYDREEAEEAVDKLVFEDKHGFAYSEKKSAYLGGEVSRSTLKNILIKEMEYEEEKAELTMKAYDWQKSHPESKHDTTTIMSYLKPLEGLGMSANDCGISVDTFAKEKKYIASIKSDKDENGKGIPYSRINKAFPYIASLPLSSEQKTAFAVACGWELKTVNKKKLW